MIRVPHPLRVPPPSSGSGTGRYTLLPFRFLHFDEQRTLLVNDLGEFAILDHEDFRKFVQHRLDTNSDVFASLRARYFLAEHISPALIRMMAGRLRLKKSFLTGFTKLHIFVVTLRCDHTCQYCQVSRQTSDRSRFDMSRETADRSLDLMFRSPATYVTMEFQGGESLLNFQLIKYLILRAEQLNGAYGKQIDFVIATNLAMVTQDILQFCKDHDVRISTSLDGPAFIHNANRPRPGANSYEVTISGIGKARETLGVSKVSALMTTTRLSLEHPKDIIDEYVSQGFRSIFLRPIRPYGFALKTRRTTGYDFERFMDFYKTGLDYIIQLNLAGIDFQESYAKIILTKILTPFSTHYVDLQSPSGLGIGVVVYNYDGSVYASDESRMLAEMGDYRFRLGSVGDSYEAIFGGETLRSTLAASCVETLPGCSECAFQAFCGTDPVYHHAVQGDLFGHRPTSDFHKKNFGIIKFLFQRLLDDPDAKRVFLAWVMDKSLSEIKPEALI